MRMHVGYVVSMRRIDTCMMACTHISYHLCSLRSGLRGGLGGGVWGRGTPGLLLGIEFRRGSLRRPRSDAG
jgi:hypothetical protein